MSSQLSTIGIFYWSHLIEQIVKKGKRHTHGNARELHRLDSNLTAIEYTG
jgi:hypothetical protein